MRLRRESFCLRELEGETIVLDLASSRYLLVNASGTVLLRELWDTRSHAQLAEALLAEFDVDPVTAARDVQAFVDGLNELGLLDVGNEG